MPDRNHIVASGLIVAALSTLSVPAAEACFVQSYELKDSFYYHNGFRQPEDFIRYTLTFDITAIDAASDSNGYSFDFLGIENPFPEFDNIDGLVSLTYFETESPIGVVLASRALCQEDISAYRVSTVLQDAAQLELSEWSFYFRPGPSHIQGLKLYFKRETKQFDFLHFLDSDSSGLSYSIADLDSSTLKAVKSTPEPGLGFALSLLGMLGMAKKHMYSN